MNYEYELNRWLNVPTESECLEFKEAKSQFDKTTLLEYCVALGNEGGGHLVLGVTNKMPRLVVGTQAFQSAAELNDLKLLIFQKLRIRVDVTQVNHEFGRVLIFAIPSRPLGRAINLDGKYLMRAGESLVAMTDDRLKSIHQEDAQDWFALAACSDVGAADLIEALDVQTYFEMIGQPYPSTRDGVISRLESEELIIRRGSTWTITNLAAILLAKRLDFFSIALARRAPRFIVYNGMDKTNTRSDLPGTKGYAVGFEGLVEFVHAAAPQNRLVEEVLRTEVKMFPRSSLRELIANAFVHQDFQSAGGTVMIEMYDDRVEISNPGVPFFETGRFIVEYRSRNERLADLMRRLTVCEAKGSGVKKVVKSAEIHQLPAPDFRVDNFRTTATLFAHQDFADMGSQARIRACFQHCALCYVSNQRMSNRSLRERFGLNSSPSSTSKTSQVIAATRDAGLIKQDNISSRAGKSPAYIPYFA